MKDDDSLVLFSGVFIKDHYLICRMHAWTSICCFFVLMILRMTPSEFRTYRQNFCSHAKTSNPAVWTCSMDNEACVIFIVPLLGPHHVKVYISCCRSCQCDVLFSIFPLAKLVSQSNLVFSKAYCSGW